MIISKSNDCPYCGNDHSNKCFVTYVDGHHCFSCGKGTRKGSEHFAFRDIELKTSDDVLWLPEHTTNPKEFSVDVLMWLYDYFVFEDLIKKYEIAYCPPQFDKSESLLFPILDSENKVIEYQRRFFPDKSFYSTPGVKKCIFVPSIATNSVTNGLPKFIVLVEDYISAIRVAKYFPCLCVFGTSLSQNQVTFIINNFNGVKIWFDNDEPGYKAAMKNMDRLFNAFSSYLGPMIYKRNSEVEIEVVLSDKQPKEHTNREILDKLGC